MSDYAEDLDAIARSAAARLRELNVSFARQAPAPGKWSPAEIIGHLIDSASNNHQRFVRAQFRPDLRFDGYEQDRWVDVQRYREAPWLELVSLWEGFNIHLARLMDIVPDVVRSMPRSDHNLHELAWETMAAEATVTLDYFMRDYVNHLKHHLRQIDPALCGRPSLQQAPGSGTAG